MFDDRLNSKSKGFLTYNFIRAIDFRLTSSLFGAFQGLNKNAISCLILLTLFNQMK